MLGVCCCARSAVILFGFASFCASPVGELCVLPIKRTSPDKGIVLQLDKVRQLHGNRLPLSSMLRSWLVI